MKQFLCNDQPQVVTDRNPYLCKDCILCRSKGRHDMQMLLDPFKEQLYLTAFPIKLRNRKGNEGKVVRQESIHIVHRIDFIINHAYHLRMVLHDGCSCEPDTLVR